MKKILLLVVVSLLFLGCSKSDDNNSKELTPNLQNMVGDWVFTTIIKADGSQEPYNHFCSTEKDYARITNTSGSFIKAYYHSPTCAYNEYRCEDYYFNGNRIINCFEAFDDARVTSLTSTTMKLEYDDDKVYGSIIGVARGMILVKK